MEKVAIEKPGWFVVEMGSVPEPPARGGNHGKLAPLWEAIRALPRDESKAIRVSCRDQKHLYSIRSQLRKRAQREGTEMLSSRNAGGTLAWFWLSASPPVGKRKEA